MGSDQDERDSRVVVHRTESYDIFADSPDTMKKMGNIVGYVVAEAPGSIQVLPEAIGRRSKGHELDGLSQSPLLKSLLATGGRTVSAVKCPSCGANVDIPRENDLLKCRYCGQTLQITHLREGEKEAMEWVERMKHLNPASHDIAELTDTTTLEEEEPEASVLKKLLGIGKVKRKITKERRSHYETK